MRTFSKSFIRDFEGQDIVRKNSVIFSTVLRNSARNIFRAALRKKFKNFFSGNENKKLN